MSIILASQSPRRKELLGYITENFTVKVSDVEEVTDTAQSPEEIVISLARIKGEAVFADNKSDTVISADTVVVLDGKILGKPHSREEAYEMLSSLSGRTHTVFTGVCVFSQDKVFSFAEKTQVQFCPLTENDINAYIETGEPFDKAGAYGIQGKGCVLVEGIVGDYYNVMGLPVAHLCRLLKENSLI